MVFLVLFFVLWGGFADLWWCFCLFLVFFCGAFYGLFIVVVCLCLAVYSVSSIVFKPYET